RALGRSNHMECDTAAAAAVGRCGAGFARRSREAVDGARRVRAADPNARRRRQMSTRFSVRGSLSALLVALLVTVPEPAAAYLKLGVTVAGRTVTLRWAQTPRYFVSVRSTVPGVTVSDFEGAVARAFAKWEAVPTASITYQYGGLTTARPGEDD